MKNLLISFLTLALCAPNAGVFSQDLKKEFPLSFTVTVSNPLKTERENELVFVSAEKIRELVPDFNPKAFVVLDQGKEIPSQYNTRDSQRPGIVFVLEKLNGSAARVLAVRYQKKGESPRSYTKRTQAELSHKTGGQWVNREYIGGAFKNVDYLRVPPEHKDHSWFIRYEGPGWESDKVGYRFYLDQRNAADVFGKKTPAMVLQHVGQDGFDSYHNMQPWGMDVAKVGKSLGVGSIGAWQNGSVTRVEKTDSVTCQVEENGDVYSSILTSYYGWKVGRNKYDVKSQIAIHAGTRITFETIDINKASDSLCTGIIKDKLAQLITSKGDGSHLGYIATYGKQSLNNDELGLAVFFRPADVVSFGEDENSHVVTLKTSGKLQYYYLAAWAGEPGGIKTEADFKKHLDAVSASLATPLKVSVRKNTGK